MNKKDKPSEVELTDEEYKQHEEMQKQIENIDKKL